LEDGTPSPVSEDVYKPISLKEIERRHIEETLKFTRWVKRETARILGIERSTLDRKLKSYGLDKPQDS
jgi:Nif-specific regulatory protein